MKRKREETKEAEKESNPPKRIKRAFNGVWISNLPEFIEKNDLEKYVCEIGKISSVVLFKDNTKTSKSNTCAGVIFDGKMADDALEYNGAKIMGQRIGLRYLKEKDFSVHMMGINHMKEEEIEKIFKEAGEVTKVTKLKRSKYEICFKNLEDVENCLKYSGSDIDGRIVNVISPNFAPEENTTSEEEKKKQPAEKDEEDEIKF